MKNYSKPIAEKVEFDYINNIVASGIMDDDNGHGHGNGNNNGRWGNGNPNSHNGGQGIGAWEGGKNHDNFP